MINQGSDTLRTLMIMPALAIAFATPALTQEKVSEQDARSDVEKNIGYKHCDLEYLKCGGREEGCFHNC